MEQPSKDHHQDNEEYHYDSDSIERVLSNKKERSPLDGIEEFQDPFSDVSLFLAKRIKNELLREKNPKKWSNKIQTLLVQEILPDFTKRFPRYRLGNAVLKKTWEKVLYYLQIIQQEKGALQTDGRLNLPYIIKRNLSKFSPSELPQSIHPYNSAHNLAGKISEFIATYEGERPNLEELTKTIWAVQKHLIVKNKDGLNSPFEKYDPLDKLVVRFQLEEIAKSPLASKDELIESVKNRFTQLRMVHQENLILSTSILFANKLYSSLSIHKTLPKEHIELLKEFIRKQITLCRSESTVFSHKERLQLVSRILFLYKLSCYIDKTQIESSLQAAVSYVYSLSTDSFSPQGPVLRQEVYTFIDTEISLQKERKNPEPLKALLSTLVNLFHEIAKLPSLSPDKQDDLEVLIWHTLYEEETTKESHLSPVLLEEIANIHIDHPQENFQSIVNTTVHYFRKLRQLDLSLLDKKLHVWTIQNDLICHWLHFDETLPLLKLIKRGWKSQGKEEASVDHEEFVQSILKTYLKSHPSFAGWEADLKIRITLLYKYFWYTYLAKEGETAYNRFLAWHKTALSLKGKHSKEALEAIVERLLPLTPLQRSIA